MNNWLNKHINKYKKALDNLPKEKIQQAIDMVHDCCRTNNQIFIVGNGGSSANASHFAVDLGKGSSDVMKEFFERTSLVADIAGNKRFRVMSLNDNIPWMMAIINDYCQEDVFWRQLENFATKDDLLICVSVSGKSPNVVKAAKWAKENDLKVLALTNWTGGDLITIADKTIKIESSHYAVVEDLQMLVLHAICYEIIENYDFERNPNYENIKSLMEKENKT